jgi:hypothetical protein
LFEFVTSDFLILGLREWLHVVAPNRGSYELKYFDIAQDEEEIADN